MGYMGILHSIFTTLFVNIKLFQNKKFIYLTRARILEEKKKKQNSNNQIFLTSPCTKGLGSLKSEQCRYPHTKFSHSTLSF